MLPLHHDPVLGRAYAFQADWLQHPFAPSHLVVVTLRVELSTTRLSAVSGRPALDYHVPTPLSLQSGWQDSNLRLRVPKARGFAATLHPVIQSERADLNRRSPGPRPGAIPRLRYVLVSSGPYGSRTRLTALKGWCPQTDRRTGRSRRAPSTQTKRGFCSRISRSGSGGARIRVCGFSGRRYTISATDPNKKARCRCDTGLSVFLANRCGRVSRAQWIEGECIRRLTGDGPFPSSLFGTRSY